MDWSSGRGHADRRPQALLGLGGALLAAIGDVLILGRRCSGPQFDQALGVVPAGVEVDRRWRSLWNGAGLSRRRILWGTFGGVIGIAMVELFGLRPVTRDISPGALRRIATLSSAGFGVSGAVTHLACAAVILAYQEEALTVRASSASQRRTPRLATGLLAASSVATLSALAAFSLDLTAARLLGRNTSSFHWSAAMPFPCVVATLLTFGRLPAPVGGYARPASINVGLAACLVGVAVTDEARRSTSSA